MFLSQGGNLVFNSHHSKFLTKSSVLVINQLSYYLKNYSSCINDGKNYYYCTNKKLSSDLKVNERTIRRAILQLKNIGIIEVKNLAKRKWNRTNYYAINHSVLTELTIKNSNLT